MLFVTGLSGAGISSALKILEDLGHEVFDNLPLRLIDTLGPEDRPIAVGIDTRTREFDTGQILEKARQMKARLVFITCDESVLQKRFSETRRRHPLASDRPVSAGIKKELSLLHPLREAADPVIDTTDLNIHDLRRIIAAVIPRVQGSGMTVTLQSFGYKNGLPREADIVMDVRFLKNPHWNEDLKTGTGRDAPVQEFIKSDQMFNIFVDHFKALLDPLLDRYLAEGKTYLTIALGCTGGKHRSVFVAETLAPWIEAKGHALTVVHRDINRG